MTDETTRTSDIPDLLDKIEALPANWHGVGSVTPKVLRAIARHAQRIGEGLMSIETGSGKTTLLFSHLSAKHLVFAINEGDSITQVRNSALFNPQNVTFVEGLTQITLAKHNFEDKVQIALIDGPHGYPFPDLEYFYLYPLIEKDGLLLVDDIKIPTIHRMFEIIKADDMFELLEIVDDNMAFFQRTEVPCVSLTSDSWWRQGYNRTYYLNPSAHSLTRYSHPRLLQTHRTLSRLAPEWAKGLLPKTLRRKLWNALHRVSD